MKTKIVRALKHAIPLLMVMFIAYSCSESTQDYLDEYEIRRMIEEEIRKNNQGLEFTQWEIVNVKVEKKSWKWYEDTKRYEAVVDLPELSEFIYEDGIQLGYVFIGEQNVNEKQIMLPYNFTYYEDVDNEGLPILVYTETISCDFQLGSPSNVTFNIQTSDLYPINEDFVIDRYFRIVLVW